MKKLKLVADDAIPYLEGRVEHAFDMVRLPGAAIRRDDLMDADALAVRTRTRCNRALLEGTPVRVVGTATIGMDHFCRPELDAMGIPARNAPGCNAPAVAQYVWGTLMHMGFDPKHDTLGIVGCGNVGGLVRAWGQLLGVRMLICDPPRALAKVDDIEYHSLAEVMSECDAVTFHTPLIRDGEHPTWHLADAAHLAMLRPGALLINAARGGVVDEAALKEVMESRGVRAVLDTWEGEPLIDLDMLARVQYGTPHIAGYSQQGKERATSMLLDTLEDVLGVSLDKSGLAGRYTLPDTITPEMVRDAYSPVDDDILLRSAPREFERLRDTYPLRNELF